MDSTIIAAIIAATVAIFVSLFPHLIRWNKNRRDKLEYFPPEKGALGRQGEDGFCYLNKEGIDTLYKDFGQLSYSPKNYREKVISIILRLRKNNELSRTLEPTEKGYVYGFGRFKLYADDEDYLQFESMDYPGVYMHMRKVKATLWPHKSSVNQSRSHYAMLLHGDAGMRFRVFGQYQSLNYLRPHAVRCADYTLNYSVNTLK